MTQKNHLPARPGFLPPEGEEVIETEYFTLYARCDLIKPTYPNLQDIGGEPAADVLFDLRLKPKGSFEGYDLAVKRVTHVVPLGVLKDTNIPAVYVRTILQRLTHGIVHSLGGPIEGALMNWAGVPAND
jgi:hypothetical protein